MSRKTFLLFLMLTALTALARPTDAQQDSPPNGEIRGFWVDAFHAGIKSPAEIDTLLERVRRANANTVFAQVRKRGDAYYLSSYEPRASEIPAGFDPLRCLIQKARQSRPRIAVHAWINAAAVGPPTGPGHLLAKHPEWRSVSDTGDGDDKEVVKIDPGVPDAQEWTVRVVRDIVRRYGVDGVCLDYIRYGGARWGYAPASVARFNAFHGREGVPTWDDPLWQQWRRDQVTDLVRRIYAEAVAIRPQIVVGAAVIAWGNGPQTDADWTQTSAYRSVYQDWRGWLEEGILDLANPMTYFAAHRHRAFQESWSEWIKERSYGRATTIAVGNYLNTMPDTVEFVRLARAPSASGRSSTGTTLFSYFATAVKSSPEGERTPDYDNDRFYGALKDAFPAPAALPAFPWKTQPTKGHVAGTVLAGADLRGADGVEVVLSGNGTERVQRAGGTGYYAFIDVEPGAYSVTVRHADLSEMRMVEVAPGRVSVLDFHRDRDALPEPRPVTGIGAAGNGARVVLERRLVTVGSDRLGDRFRIADSAAGATIAVQPAGSLTMPLVAGDIVTLSGTLKIGAGSKEIAADAVRVVGSRPR